MSNQNGLKSILGLEFYKKQKDWKFERQLSTFDFDRDPEKPVHRRQVSEKQYSFTFFASVDQERQVQYCGKINKKQTFDSSRNSSCYNNLSKRDKRTILNSSKSYNSDGNSQNITLKKNNGHNSRILQNKSDLNGTYELKKYINFGIYNDETIICDDKIDAKLEDTYNNMEPTEFNTTFEQNITESVVVIPDDILSGSMQALYTKPYIEDLVSEEQFLMGASKKFHSSAVDLQISDIPLSGFKDIALSSFTRPVYPVPDEDELERMRNMSYKELMREIVLEHMQMQHLERKTNIMKAMINRVEFDTTNDIRMNRHFSYANAETVNDLKKRNKNKYQFITGLRIDSTDSYISYLDQNVNGFPDTPEIRTYVA